MDEIITRAKNSINKISKSNWYGRQLVDASDLLNQLLEPNFARKDWAQLFCRQLKRLMDYNNSIEDEIWIECYKDLWYIVKDPNGKQDKGNNWDKFLERMKFESKLVERELQFQKTFEERKILSELCCEHKKFLQEYFHKCIFLHSKVQVRGLIKYTDNLLSMIDGLIGVSLTSESEKRLKKKLSCIEINFDCSNKSFQCSKSTSSTYKNPPKRVNKSGSNFFPSIELTEMRGNIEKVAKVLEYNRWVVILGDPGSGKTNLLRWFTRIFAEAALRNDEQVDFGGNVCIPVRIPILIRIGEFASWLDQEQNKTKTLIDYIGEHTWFSERYCHIDSANVLKELIYHGHALILLDGLDEIPEVRRRGEIVDLVEKFIDEYVRGPDFFSAFDHYMLKSESLGAVAFFEMQPPRKSGGNQIVVTSRIIGYRLYPLTGSLIQNYSLLLMDHKESKQFVKQWMGQIEKCILENLLSEGIQIDKEIMESISERRIYAVESMFIKCPSLLMFSPSLLSIICTSIFQSFDEFHPNSRIEVYHHTAQTALEFLKTHQSSISESILTNFLIELATYLHLQSPSGLIDAFDLEHLCCSSLKQQGVSNNRMELRSYAHKLISLLDLNAGIVAERGLQVFGFCHLSFQEYYVAQALLKGSSIDEIVERIIKFTINPRFRESTLLAVGWISWKWSFNDYNKFCNLLITSAVDYEIPVGTLLFLDAFTDMSKLPSNSVIFTALNNLLNNRSWDIRSKYLLKNLSKLSDEMIRDWIQLYLKDDKCIFNFFQSFIIYHKQRVFMSQYAEKLKPIVYQYLWSCHNRSPSAEFIIDQTLRRIVISTGITNQIFNKELSSYLLSHDICKSTIHPLILSVIIAICGGVRFRIYGGQFNISFSPKYMHRESSILIPIVKYFENDKESHSIKIQVLINDYQNSLDNFFPSDTSIDIVDTFIALICLRGVSQPSIYEKYKEYKALPLALERFKWIWYYLNESSSYTRGDLSPETGIYFIEHEIKSIMNVFSQFDPSDEQILSFSLACATSCKKLRMLDVTNTLQFNNSLQIDQHLRYQSEFISFIDENKLDLMAKNISSLDLLKKKPFFLLNFLPKSLRQLYSCTIISPINKTDSLPLIVFLTQCLTHLENLDKYDSNFYFGLIMLQSLLKEHMLENYALGILWEKYFDTKIIKSYNTKHFLKAINDRKLLDPFYIDQLENLESFIKIEQQRILKANTELKNQEKDLTLFAASISLARLYQVQYRLCKYKTIKHISISLVERNNVYFAILNIHSPIVRILALNSLLNMKDPLIFEKQQGDKLQWQTVFLLNSIFPNLSLLASTILLIQCYTIIQMFPLVFQSMANVIGKKLNKISIDKQKQGQEAAYIALKQLNNSDLSSYLSEFAKQTTNLSDVLHFNSTIFFNYITKLTSLDSLNPILLSVLYLNELIFDVQNLKMYTGDNYKKNNSSLKDFEELTKFEKIMSLKAATWITNSLQILNKREIHQIIEYISRSPLIEKNALSMMNKWIDYRTDKHLKIFSQYAALQLIIERSDNLNLMDIINDMFLTKNWYRLISLVERLFNSQLVDSMIFRQILFILQKNVYYSSKIFVSIDCKQNFQSILTLEYERITSNRCRQTKTSTRPFLLMIKDCSKDLQVYLLNYLQTFIIEDSIQEEYIATVIKWIIECSIFAEYDYILTLLHNHEFPQIQKAIVNGLSSTFLRIREGQESIFLKDNVINNLEKVICSWNIYSKDVVAICLLAYRNCLVQRKINENVLCEIQNVLEILSENFFPEIISIRASFCLIVIKHSYTFFNDTLTWFQNKWNLTPKETYYILLNQTLYEIREASVGLCMEGFIQHLDKYSDELMDTFVTDLYIYLCDKNNRNYLSDPLPDYIILALKVQEKDWNKFHNAVEKSSFGEENAVEKSPSGEEKFLKELNIHYINNRRDSYYSLLLYVDFGILNIELVDMLERSDSDGIFRCLTNIERVSDRDVIEKFVRLVDMNMSGTTFGSYLHALKYLAGMNDVSLIEIHQTISQIINVSFDPDDIWSNREQEIFNLLLDISCFNNEEVSVGLETINVHLDQVGSNSEKIRLHFEKIFINKNKIDEEFHREIEYLEKKAALFFGENPFLNDFSSISN